LPSGEYETDALEGLFSLVETRWPPIIERMSRKEDVNDAVDDIFQFVALQRARVPLLRDAIEVIEAERVKLAMMAMTAMGMLPPPPAGCPDLLDQVAISVDPHRSILAMPAVIRATGTVLDRAGFGILHNRTAVPFLSSDNPVVYFDPTIAPEMMRPYTLKRNDGHLVVLMPLTPSMLLYGHSINKREFDRVGITHSDLADERKVLLINEQICRFAYDAVFANQEGFEPFVQPLALTSPVVHFSTLEVGGLVTTTAHFEFGCRPSKPKWDPAVSSPTF
jgi:hypothetical protein